MLFPDGLPITGLPTLFFPLSLAEDGIYTGILGHLRKLLVFPWVSPMYNMLINWVFFSYSSVLFQRSQPRAQRLGENSFSSPARSFPSVPCLSPVQPGLYLWQELLPWALDCFPDFVPAEFPPPPISHCHQTSCWAMASQACKVCTCPASASARPKNEPGISSGDISVSWTGGSYMSEARSRSDTPLCAAEEMKMLRLSEVV